MVFKISIRSETVPGCGFVFMRSICSQGRHEGRIGLRACHNGLTSTGELRVSLPRLVGTARDGRLLPVSGCGVAWF